VGQGYGAVKGRVGEVEVWGLGGASADELQAKYQHRENMFSEQRRKVCAQFWDRNQRIETVKKNSIVFKYSQEVRGELLCCSDIVS